MAKKKKAEYWIGEKSLFLHNTVPSVAPGTQIPPAALVEDLFAEAFASLRKKGLIVDSLDNKAVAVQKNEANAKLETINQKLAAANAKLQQDLGKAQQGGGNKALFDANAKLKNELEKVKSELAKAWKDRDVAIAGLKAASGGKK